MKRSFVSLIYLSLSNKWKSYHGAVNSRSRKLRMALKKYFWFHWNCKQLWVEGRNIMSNCEICFPLSSELYLQFSKYFHSMVLGNEGRNHCKKKRVLEFLAKVFWLGCLSAFKSLGTWNYLDNFYLT